MLKYGIANLGPETPSENIEKLRVALAGVKGIKDIDVVPARREITFGITGPEPKLRLLTDACASVGFTLGSRT